MRPMGRTGPGSCRDGGTGIRRQFASKGRAYVRSVRPSAATRELHALGDVRHRGPKPRSRSHRRAEVAPDPGAAPAAAPGSMLPLRNTYDVRLTAVSAHAVAVAVDLQDGGVVQQAVKDRGGDGAVVSASAAELSVTVGLGSAIRPLSRARRRRAPLGVGRRSLDGSTVWRRELAHGWKAPVPRPVVVRQWDEPHRSTLRRGAPRPEWADRCRALAGAAMRAPARVHEPCPRRRSAELGSGVRFAVGYRALTITQPWMPSSTSSMVAMEKKM